MIYSIFYYKSNPILFEQKRPNGFNTLASQIESRLNKYLFCYFQRFSKTYCLWLILQYYLMGSQIPRLCVTCHAHSPRNPCQICKEYSCNNCFDYPVVKTNENDDPSKPIDYYSACLKCFLEKADLDFTKTYDIVGDQNKKQLIFIHGGGSSRKMFLPHAKELAKKGYKSILIDLPAHGARYKEDLTINACVDVIKETIELCKTNNFTMIGGSLGGYIIMEFIGRQPQICKNAVVMMAGQDVGVNRGLLASFGLWGMGKATSFLSQTTIAKKFMQTAGSNKYLNSQMIQDLSKCGVYFKKSEQQISLLKETNPRLNLEKANGATKCLFINGSKDHRNSEQIWLQAAGQASKLIVYEEGDHFFSHDNRFFERLINDIDQFITED